MSVNLASDKYKELRAEVSRMASMANKRLNRLENNNLTMLPAYQEWEQNGSIRFSVKGKDYNQLQAEFWRLKNFLDDRTSTVREANAFLREMAENTGIKYNGLEDLKNKSARFFELAEKIREYNQAIGQAAQALDYQKIWQQINTAVQQDALDLSEAVSSDEQLERFLDFMNEVQPVEDNKEGYSLTNSNFDFVEI
jgi:DNA repair ATPase RecN